MKILNKAQVEALFQREAALIGMEDAVLSNRAAELFGKDAVNHACSIGTGGTGRNWNVYGVRNYNIKYLTLNGFYAAATFYNIQQLREAEQE